MIYKINGKEVEYINIDKNNDIIDIQYYEKFDVVTAHTSRIEKKLKEKKINNIVCKDLYRAYIGIFLEYLEDYIGVIHILGIPMNACTIDKENNFLIIHINKLPKYQNKSFKEVIKESED